MDTFSGLQRVIHSLQEISISSYVVFLRCLFRRMSSCDLNENNLRILRNITITSPRHPLRMGCPVIKHHAIFVLESCRVTKETNNLLDTERQILTERDPILHKRGVPHPASGYPISRPQGTPIRTGCEYPPVGTGWGYPLSGLDGGTLCQDWRG